MNSARDLPLTVFKPHVQIYAIVQLGGDDYSMMGHGFLSIITDQIENQTVHYIEVQSRGDNEVLLRSRLQSVNSYEKQRGSVIVWNDCERRTYCDLAISFESVNQCDIYWQNRRLICEKIGKNYLDISGRDPLELPTETNLSYILDKTKNSRDLVEYNILNSPAFLKALISVFKKFQTKNDNNGMGLIGKIVKSIFNNLDYRMIEVLFKDPVFDLLLQVHKFLQKIDFPRCWAQKLKIRSLIPLNDQLSNKVKIVHRLSFYRQSILDLMKEINLQQMLVMTQVQFSKDIILHLTKDEVLEDIIKTPFYNSQDQLSLLPNLCKELEDETLLSQNEEIKRRQFYEKKLQFLMQSLAMSKQIQDENARNRFLQKLYKSGAIEMAAEYLDRGIFRALDFLVFLVQSSQPKFMQFLKANYKQSPTSNLYMKLCRKYNTGSQQMQNSILEIVKYLAQGFKVKENMDFFNDKFFSLVFGGCKDQKALLAVLSEVQNKLESVESFFEQAIKSKVFFRLSSFLKSQKQEKTTELKAIKLLKRVLSENSGTSWTAKKIFLQRLNTEIIKSGFFQYCMLVLQKNMKLNNVICSSMLENLKILSQIARYTKFHDEIQKKYRQGFVETKFISKILEVKEEEIPQDVGIEGQQAAKHKLQLEQEQEEAQLLSQMDQEQVENPNPTNTQEQLEQLQSVRRIRREISIQEQQKEERELDVASHASKKVKEIQFNQYKQQSPVVVIELNLALDEIEKGGK